ncbi:MAG: hypothetical protein ACRES9_04960 [Gammaproteobacteria bacterium]
MSARLAGVALGAVAICGLAFAPAAFADYAVHSPNVEQGENEIEWNGFASWGTNPESGAIQGSKFEFGRGMNDFWYSEIEFNSEKEGGNNLRPTELEWENRFQLTPQGKYWLDTGLYSEIEYQRGGAWKITVGPPGAPRTLIGPGLTGKIRLAEGQGLHWRVIMLFGASAAAADTTLALHLSYEFRG